MLESSDLQPSFTSSTYRAIADKALLIPKGDRPLAEEPEIQAFLNAPDTGLIPEYVLYRLLTIVELTLKQKFPEKKLAGLCLGYTLKSRDNSSKSDNISESFYVSWGWTKTYDDLLKPMIQSDEIQEIEELDEGKKNEQEAISNEFSALTDLIEVEISRYAESRSTSKMQPCVFVFGHFDDDFYEMEESQTKKSLRFMRTEEIAISIKKNHRVNGKTACNCTVPGDSDWWYRNSDWVNGKCKEKCKRQLKKEN